MFYIATKYFSTFLKTKDHNIQFECEYYTDFKESYTYYM